MERLARIIKRNQGWVIADGELHTDHPETFITCTCGHKIYNGEPVYRCRHSGAEGFCSRECANNEDYWA